MSKKDKKKKGQFDHYKKWTTDEGYTFLAETKEDAILYLKHMKHSNLGSSGKPTAPKVHIEQVPLKASSPTLSTILPHF